MSFLGGGSSGGNQSTTQAVTPYGAAEPALGQILSEATNLYGQGVGAAGYVAPTTQTLTGLAGQETMANAAQQQLAATLGGQYLNPFLSPLIQRAGADISTAVQSQFSGAGRTPTSPLAQQQALAQVAQAALPLAFQTYGQEREAIQRQQQIAPFQALQQYAGLVSPIAAGFPTRTGGMETQANPFTTALGGALVGGQFGGAGGALLGGFGGLLGGLL